MQLSAIGPYQVRRHLGRGGMGEVFLAQDTRLDRQVAIKALPAHLAQDPDRLARFQREAKVLASLSHPGIAAIYGLEEADGHQYLILEFVDGETLADRLADGPIPVQDALAIARQIAEAVEAAHEKGIVHRDLKPANVMVTADGAVKVLDFGLARTAEGPASGTSAAGLADSPTVPLRSPTIPGAIMGTAGYMSPEQARGKPVDKRSDIFSFGCILYEMLSGAGPFPGETVTDSLGAILHREPDWSLLPREAPARARELLRNCLAKDRRNRLHDIGDARLELERAIAGHEWTAAPAPARAPAWRTPAALLAAGALVAAGWALASTLRRVPPRPPTTPIYAATLLDAKPSFNSLSGISPDGRFLVYAAWPELPPESVKPMGVLAVRRLDRDETAVIDGTEGARDAALSPDSRWVAFAAAKDRAATKFVLKRIALDGGRPTGRAETICDLPQGSAPVICWASDREIAVATNFGLEISAVAVSGGDLRVIVREEARKAIESWSDLRPLAPGRSILATRWAFIGQKIKLTTEAIDLASGARTPVLPDAGGTVYVPDGETGYLLASRAAQTSLFAARFDPRTQRTLGDPVTVWSGNPITSFRLSPAGTLAVATRPAEVLDRRLAWIDDKGAAQPIPGLMRSYGQIYVSPDGARVLAVIENPGSAELDSEVCVQDLARRTSVRIPLQGAIIELCWSPDGQQFAYGLAKDGAFSIWQRRSDGSGEPVRLVSSPDSRTLLVPSRWTPDGKSLAFVQVDLSADNGDVYLATPDPATGQWSTRPYIQTPGNEDTCRFSPDGKWVLFWSTQSGRQELYVQPFTGNADADARAGRRQVSPAGATFPRAWWSPDGKEIRYVDPDLQLTSVQVTTEPTFSAGEPKALCSIKDLKTRDLCFAPDGRLLAVLKGESEQTATSVGLVIHFLDELRAKLGKPE